MTKMQAVIVAVYMGCCTHLAAWAQNGDSPPPRKIDESKYSPYPK
jgi:hypothetical protein